MEQKPEEKNRAKGGNAVERSFVKGIFNHLGLKILSIVLAVLFWVIVMNLSDYSMTKTIYNIPVEQQNGETIEEMGKVYDVIDGNTVDVVVKGPRSIVDSLTVSDFYAYADLGDLSVTNSAAIRVQAREARVNSSIEIHPVDETMNLTIEDKVDRELSIKAIANGDVAEGYAIGGLKVTPNIIRISGPQSIIDRVTEVRASIDTRGVSANLKKTVTPVCINAYNESMADRPIELSVSEVTVELTVYPTKTIPVKLNTLGSPASDYSIVELNYKPQEVTVAGPEDVLEKVNAIYIADISVDGINENKETNVMIDNYLPENVILADSNTEVAVNIVVEEQAVREIEVSASDIAMMGMNVAYDYTLKTSKAFKIRLKGLEADIANVSKESLQLSVDATDLPAGEHVMKLSYASPKNTTVTVLGKVTLEVTEKEETTETTDPQNPEGGGENGDTGNAGDSGDATPTEP